MKGIFIGTDGSMGFHRGEIYEVASEIAPIQKRQGNRIVEQQCIIIRTKDPAVWCPYESLEAVMRNWSFEFIK